MGYSLNSIFFFIILPILIINQFLLHLPVDAAKDALSQGDEIDSLDHTSNLISEGGTFTTGFFNDPITNFTYLGIWYTNYARKVWVANGDFPMNSSGSLIIDESGTLKVVIRGGSGSNTTMFNVSNEFVGSSSTTAVLKDTGNLVLYYDENRNRILWQSFDYPTDTLLPGMKVGYNLTTGQNWTLTSWFSDWVPASGAFTMRLEHIQNSAQLVIYRRGMVYWSSGSLVNDGLDFESLHSYYSNFGNGFIVSDASGMYFAIHSGNTNDGISILQLSSMGELIDGISILQFLTPKGGLCYGHQSNLNQSRCAISALPSCRRASHGFDIKDGEWYVIGLIQNDNSSNISLSDCMERCWNDCKCKGFSSSNNTGTGCVIWGENAEINYITNNPTKVGVLLTGGVPEQPKSKAIKTWKWILISVAILLTFTITTYLCYIIIRRCRLEGEKRRREQYIQQLTGSTTFIYGDKLEKNINNTPDVMMFNLRTILAATDNFSNENKLGEGGYGSVYKGKLFDGRQIAVKRLSKTSEQGSEEFKNELILISKLQHTNLVQLYGCCIHKEEKMLIYEYMPNKSLDIFLFDNKVTRIATLAWRMRFNIIEGVAQGLLYLHKYSRMQIIHRDLKVGNVLLDECMNPKIADFGMARIFQQNMTEAITNRVVGTYGYMAPEYAMGGTFSIKSDVFSFGVLVLEIVSGKRNSSFYNLDRAHNLVGYAWELWKDNTSLELKDELLGESFNLKQLQRTIHVGLLCVQENADDRPTMSKVIYMLNNEFADLSSPKQPAFLTCTQQVEAELHKNIPVLSMV